MTAEDMIEAVDGVRPLRASVGEVLRFMIASCDLITGHMPAVAISALDVARRYWNGEAAVSELDRARVQCWRYLDERGSGTATNEPEVCATRAVICVLYPALEEEDLVELTHWFIQLTQRVADIDREQCDILQRLFGAVLPAT